MLFSRRNADVASSTLLVLRRARSAGSRRSQPASLSARRADAASFSPSCGVSIFVFLQALRADVAFSLQRLRRRFLKLRKLLLKRLGCTDDRHEKHLLEQRKQLDFFAAFEKSSPLSREKKKEEACAMESDVWLPQCVCRQLLAGTDTLLLIVRDFFGQK